jgi:hypothetical protein
MLLPYAAGPSENSIAELPADTVEEGAHGPAAPGGPATGAEVAIWLEMIVFPPRLVPRPKELTNCEAFVAPSTPSPEMVTVRIIDPGDTASVSADAGTAREEASCALMVSSTEEEYSATEPDIVIVTTPTEAGTPGADVGATVPSEELMTVLPAMLCPRPNVLTSEDAAMAPFTVGLEIVTVTTTDPAETETERAETGTPRDVASADWICDMTEGV